jgi:hypothetical protein
VSSGARCSSSPSAALANHGRGVSGRRRAGAALLSAPAQWRALLHVFRLRWLAAAPALLQTCCAAAAASAVAAIVVIISGCCLVGVLQQRVGKPAAGQRLPQHDDHQQHECDDERRDGAHGIHHLLQRAPVKWLVD